MVFSFLRVSFVSWGRGACMGRAARPPRGARAALAEGAHGFDFELGRWKIHIRRAQSPFADATAWDAFDGTTVNCSLWDGTEIQRWEADGPTGHIEGLTLRMYSPKSRQWTLYPAERSDGGLGPPSTGAAAQERQVQSGGLAAAIWGRRPFRRCGGSLTVSDQKALIRPWDARHATLYRRERVSGRTADSH